MVVDKHGPFGLDAAQKEYILDQVIDLVKVKQESKPFLEWLLRHTQVYHVYVLHPNVEPCPTILMCNAWGRLLTVPHFIHQLQFILTHLRHMIERESGRLCAVLRSLTIVDLDGATFWCLRGQWFVGTSAQDEVLAAFQSAANAVSTSCFF